MGEARAASSVWSITVATTVLAENAYIWAYKSDLDNTNDNQHENLKSHISLHSHLYVDVCFFLMLKRKWRQLLPL